MKLPPTPHTGTPPTLQDVLARLATADIGESRRRDLRSAVTSYAKLVGKEAASIPLDLAELRQTLDRMVPAEAEVSAKRWANLRSDLAAAIGASGLVAMLKSAGLPVDPAWEKLLAGMPQRVRAGLSRFARWASLRQVGPEGVDDAVVARFVAELELATLVRGLRDLQRKVALSWNALVRLAASLDLKEVTVPSFKPGPTRVSWDRLPASFHQDLEDYLVWCAMPDPLDDGARVRALAPRTRRLRRDQVHSAVTAAVAAGVQPNRLVSLAALVDAEVVRGLLRHMWKEDGGKLSAYTHGVAGTLVAAAKEWIKLPADKLEVLKGLRRKLGSLPPGLTAKNENLLRRFDDPHLLRSLIELPDRLWRQASREPPGSGRAFLLFQNAIAIDLLLHAPLRMENLSALTYDRHLHWTQGQGKPVLLVLGADETKNHEKIDLELPAALGERLWTLRNSIAPRVIGSKPDCAFVTWAGTPRGQATLALAINKTVRRRLGVQVTPHQFRHIAAKIYLDQNPGGFELVRQLLGHKTSKTTISAYAGINTKRAGRAHAKLLMQIKEQEFAPTRRRSGKRKTEE
jgi:integrase